MLVCGQYYWNVFFLFKQTIERARRILEPWQLQKSIGVIVLSFLEHRHTAISQLQESKNSTF